MKDNFNRVLLCLSALELSHNELLDVINEFRSRPSEYLILRIARLREAARYELVDEIVHERRSLKSNKRTLSSTVGRIVRLLKDEAHLSNQEAAERLISYLTRDEQIPLDSIPPLNKRSFAEWLDQLSKLVPAIRLLRVATLVRNDILSAPRRDWSLSGDDHEQ